MIYNKLSELIINYLYVVYNTGMLGDVSEGWIFAVDESLFGHIKGKQLWLLGIINNKDCIYE